MQEVNSLYTDSRALQAKYYIVGIPHNIAIQFILIMFSVDTFKFSMLKHSDVHR